MNRPFLIFGSKSGKKEKLLISARVGLDNWEMAIRAALMCRRQGFENIRVEGQYGLTRVTLQIH